MQAEVMRWAKPSTVSLSWAELEGRKSLPPCLHLGDRALHEHTAPQRPWCAWLADKQRAVHAGIVWSGGGEVGRWQG
jgi:hypothetical protein